MPNSKYQIFISSTHDDLVKQRKQVIEACLTMGHIPLGMEMFTTTDEQQWEIIKKCIDESDYYVVIIAHRYGSIADGISWTEREYDYAIQQGVPVLAFVIGDKASWPSDLMDKAAAAKKLSAFKAKVRQKPVSFWETDTDLIAKSAIALGKVFNTIPRSGWVRASTVPGPEVAAEISRLSSENATLREKMALLQDEPDTARFAQDDDPVRFQFIEYGVQGTPHVDVDTTWGELFVLVGNAILTGLDETQIVQNVLMAYAKRYALDVKRPSGNSLEASEMVALKTQFIALGLIAFDQNKWSLTTKGQLRLAELTAHKR